MDVGNGSQTFFSDAVGKPMTKPLTATQLASPINLLNPDRYEFYTFDDSGDLVKRLMTLDEIQGIIASGDGEATNYNSQSLIGDAPEKRVDDVVTNVQNVLKEEMEAHKTSQTKPAFDTPDVTSTWNMILPAIFGSSSGNILPDKQNGATAETIVIEHTTLLPEVNDTMMRTEIPSNEATKVNDTMMRTEVPLNEVTKQTTVPPSTVLHVNEITTEENSNGNSEISAPIITVEVDSKKNITDDFLHDQIYADSKTESSYVSEIKSTTDDFKDSQSTQNSVQETPNIFSRPTITISSPAPFTTKSEETIPPTKPTMMTTPQKMDDVTSTNIYDTTTITPSVSSFKPTLLTSSLSTPSRKPTVTPVATTTSFPEITTLLSFSKPLSSLPTVPTTLSYNTQQTTTLPTQENTTPHGLLSTFFLIEDSKHKPESTTKVFSTPSPFILTKSTTAESTTRQKIISTIKVNPTITPVSTEEYISTTKETVPTENLKGYLDLSKTEETISTQETAYPTTQRYSSLENTIFTSTEDIAAASTKAYLQTTTEIGNEKEESVKRSTTEEESLLYSTTENLVQSYNQNTQQIPISTTEKLSEPTTLTDTTTYKINEAEKLAVTELLHQLFLTTNAYQINSELLGSTTLANNEYAADERTSTESKSEHTTDASLTTTLPNLTVKSENTSEINLISNIEQLISQSVNNPEQEIENSMNGEKISQVISNTNSKPMSEVQIETATAASALIGSPNMDTSTTKVTLSDEVINEAVDSLISQIIYEPSKTTIKAYATTTNNRETYTTTESPITTSETAMEQTTILNVNKFEDVTSANVIDSNDDRNRYEEMDLENLSLPTTTKYEGKTSKPIALNNVTDIDYVSENPEKTTLASEESLQSKISSSTELNREDTQYQSTVYPQTLSTTDKRFEDYTLSTEDNGNEEPTSTTTKPYIEEETRYDETTSTESIADSTSKSNEILSIEASEFNQESYNETSEPFLIVTSSSEYPDYASTENIDVYTKGIEDTATVTSGETKDTTLGGDLQTATTIRFAASTQNLFENTKTKHYPTTENVPISETTPDESLKDYHTTQSNFVSESFEQTSTEDYTPTRFTTDKSDSTTTSSPVQEPSSTLTTLNEPSSIYQTTTSSSSSIPSSQSFINLPMVTVAPKIEKPAELKLIQNNTTSTTPKPEMTWTLVSTVAPHKPSPSNDETKTPLPNRLEPTSVDLVPKPLQGFGLEDSTSALDTDVFQFTELCNELAFSFWSSVTSGISFARSVIVSPFAATSMLAMVFLGARGSTSGEMNEILKLDDMVTFNPHSIFKNVIESIEVSRKSGVAVSVFVKELYSDKSKGKLLSFYKERVKQFYDGHVEEVNFREINDVIRRRTNLLVKRQTWGKIQEYLKDNNIFVRPPLAAVSANIFQVRYIL